MLKKFLLILLVFLAAILSVRANSSWTIYPLYNGECSQVVETPEMVYFVSNSSLYGYDKNTQELRTFNSNNKLSENVISSITYNAKNKFLLIVYHNCNMDVLYDNGNMVNLPEIMQTSINISKSINTVNVSDDYISIGTNFGYVIYDAKRLVVKESRNWNKNILAATVVDGYIVIQENGNGYFAKLDSKHVKFEDFNLLRIGLGCSFMQTIGDALLYYNAYGKSVYKMTNLSFDGEKSVYDWDILYEIGYNVMPFQPYKDGYYAANNDEFVTIDNEGNLAGGYSLPTSLQGSKIAFWNSPSDIWVSNNNGLAQFTLNDGFAQQKNEYFQPEGMSCSRVAYISKSNDGKRIYLTNQACSDFRTCGSDNSNGYYNIQTTDMIEDGKIYNVRFDSSELPEGYGRHGEDMVLEDPLKSNRYYLVSRHYGLYVVEDGHLIGVIDDTNSAIEKGWLMLTYQFAFDQYNNLLLCNLDGSASTLVVIPYEALQDIKNMKKSDSYRFDYEQLRELEFKKENRFGICYKTGIIAISSSKQSGGMLFVDTQGRKKWDMSKSIRYKSFIDQDGNTFSPLFITFLVEDQLGHLWIGTDDGIFEITDPTKVFDNDLRVNRLKVPRNDGTNFADYLLNGEQVNWISVDPSNRKWIATQNSGVYLVSANGSEIIEHFTTFNSPLTTNTVNTIEASSIDNMVYMGTNYGPMAYTSDSSPAAENYDDVLVYPNPVRPDYTGWISITGLMENSLVKIVDAAGNIMFQDKSEGGMLSWDGCNMSGERVRSGVYFVLASSGDGNTNFATVAKLMVIK